MSITHIGPRLTSARSVLISTRKLSACPKDPWRHDNGKLTTVASIWFIRLRFEQKGQGSA
ncbi:hypothetical protein BD311DRAFT_755908 [Dichomitus squalens]|uniref:Uncharacterized protein n=1 Tax=Dichomitus squalens TaxID=114155 RepID=A0A4Q9MQN0_9APHY|nr:hypothetical protein BD311DRAFT_757973 [Dichomitus squalens]TBU29894.1 hypothetical protein BD311DRAFT_755908 [Dichomitus squalens]